MKENLCIHSLDQAEKLVSSVVDETEKEEMLYRCAESILAEDAQISGSADSFHNFSVSCLKIADDYLTAFEIVMLGLKIHPSDTDLLADIIKYGYKCGNRDACETSLEKLKEIDKKVWTWRAFSFTIDYLLECYVSDNGDSEENHTEEILAMAKQYQKRYSDREDSYFSEFEIYNRFGQKEEAINALLKAMESLDNCPKCWLRYADEMIEIGKYSEATKPIIKIHKSPDASDSINISYAHYLKGICQMNLLEQDVGNSEDDLFADTQYDSKKVEQTYLSFYNALRSDDIYENVRKKCWARVKELFAKTSVDYPECLNEISDDD